MKTILPFPKKLTKISDQTIVLNPFPAATPLPFTDASDAFCKRVKLDESGAPIVLLLDKNVLPGAYELKTNAELSTIAASDVPGINHGLATLLQLADVSSGRFAVPEVEISDFPDASWRGFMIDLARQWHPVNYIYDYIDLCWLYKLSVLQLHFTDDQSFTLPCRAYPALSTPGRTYTLEEIESVRAYARKLGVTLVPEIDAPGHSRQFNEKYPEVFGGNGILCAEEKTFAALETLYDELLELFPDALYVHVGGDEARIKNWLDCPECMAWAKENGLKDEKEMYCEYVRRVTDMILSRGKTPVVWEGFPKEGNDRIDKRVLVFSWENYYQLATELAAGGFTLLNAAWKPNYIVAPITSWTPEEILDCNIYTFRHWWENSPASKQEIVLPRETPVLGGQLCAWGDHLVEMDPHDGAEQEFALVRRRMPALAEKTWNVTPLCPPDALSAAIDASDALVVRH